MLLKKSVIFSALVIAMSGSISAYAGSKLTTFNKTKEFSTVRLDSGKCAASGIFGKHTKPLDSSIVSDIEVRLICGNASGQGTCGATIIMSPTVEDVKVCKGKEIGRAVMNVANLNVTLDANVNPDYVVTAVNSDNGAELTIAPKKN